MTGQTTQADDTVAQHVRLRQVVACAINSTAFGVHLDDQAAAITNSIRAAGLDEDHIRRDERLQIARRLRAGTAELLTTSARTEDAIGLICHMIEHAAMYRRPEPPAADEDGLT